MDDIILVNLAHAMDDVLEDVEVLFPTLLIGVTVVKVGPKYSVVSPADPAFKRLS